MRIMPRANLHAPGPTPERNRAYLYPSTHTPRILYTGWVVQMEIAAVVGAYVVYRAVRGIINFFGEPDPTDDHSDPALIQVRKQNRATLASAVSSILNTTVVTSDHCQDDNSGTNRYQALDITELFKLIYETGSFGDIKTQERASESRASLDAVDHFKIFVKGIDGEDLDIVVDEHELVRSVKKKIEDRKGYCVDQQKLVYHGKLLDDDEQISTYGIHEYATICLQFTGRGKCILYLDDSLLDQEYDYDFTDVRDDGTEYFRGEQRYYRPYGWKRLALRVRDKFSDHEWLGEGGHRVHSSKGEWPVSYHGTGENAGRSIAQHGYDLSKGHRFAYGKGIYSTPSILVAEKYAKEFQHEGETYLLVFQNRVKMEDMEVIGSSTTGVGEYWVYSHIRSSFVLMASVYAVFSMLFCNYYIP